MDKKQLINLLETEEDTNKLADKILALNDNKTDSQKVVTKYEHGNKVICIKPLVINSSSRHYCEVKEGSIHNLICANNTVGGTLGIFGIISCTNPKFEEHFKLYIKQEVKPVIFITEDGVDIFEGNEVFIVNKFFSLGFSKGVKYNNHKDNKFFSTKEKAEEYIIMNKPCLSYNDIINSIKDSNLLRSLMKDDGLLISVIKSRILKIVKNKLR
jgi:hypothetical protein